MLVNTYSDMGPSSSNDAARVVAVLQARMGSERLPGKILAEVGGVPMLELILRRVGKARRLDRLIVATTDQPEDAVVVALCARRGVECFRGSKDDCLDRICRAASGHNPDAVVRLTGDNPAPDGDFVDWVVGEYFASRPPCDYLDTMTDGTFPYGLSVEVVSFDALIAASREATEQADREHVTRFVRLRPQRFVHRALGWGRDDHDIRLTVDFPIDLQRMDGLFRTAGSCEVGWRKLIELARERRDIQ
jgi:spore coat polysaccharide biosynthesis protein SpsF